MWDCVLINFGNQRSSAPCAEAGVWGVVLTTLFAVHYDSFFLSRSDEYVDRKSSTRLRYEPSCEITSVEQSNAAKDLPSARVTNRSLNLATQASINDLSVNKPSALEVDSLVRYCRTSFLHSLRQRRVSVSHLVQLEVRTLKHLQHANLSDQLGSFRANNVRPNDLT